MAEYLSDDIDFSLYLRETDAQAKVKPAKTYSQALKDRLRGRKHLRLVYLPWTKAQDSFDFRPGEVTLWAGQNGHGKSLVTSQIALSLIGQGDKVVIASFEVKPAMTLQRMARMYCGTNPFSPEYQGNQGIAAIEEMYDEFTGWTDGRLWLYDQMGTTASEKVIGMARYCAKELGLQHIFIDNLAKCVKAEDDYNGQKDFVGEMCAIALDYGIHIHIVHHLKKPPKETDLPDKNDIKGSGAIADQVDNIFTVWRNKGKEDARKAGSDKKNDEPDTLLMCRKQRHYEGNGEGEPSIALWFNKDAGQFVAQQGDSPQFFPNWPHVQTAV